MRHPAITAALAIGAAAILGSTAAGQQARDSAVAKVVVHVRPMLSVDTVADTVDTETEPDGRFAAVVGFHVGSNRSRVVMSAAATHLYKGSDPGSPTVPPVVLATDAGVEMATDGANPSGGGTRVAHFVGPSRIGDFPAVQSERMTFESPDTDRFDQNVRLRLLWQRAGAHNPPGDYGGRINLTAMLLP